MSKYITPEYWVTCAYCGQDVVCVANAPGKRRAPRTKAEAWEVAKSYGWGGSYAKPKCEDCLDE